MGTEMSIEDLKEYFIKVFNGLWENQYKDVVNKVQLDHNVEWFKPLIEQFGSNKVFCDFLKSIEISEDNKNSKYAIFIREYQTSFLSKDHKGKLFAPTYDKLLRFLNFTTYKHNYLMTLCFSHFEKEKLKTTHRFVKTSGIVALSMKSKGKSKPVREAIRPNRDEPNQPTEYQLMPKRHEFAWSHLQLIEDTRVSTFIKYNGKSLRHNIKPVFVGKLVFKRKASDGEMVGMNGFLETYSYKYGIDTKENFLSEFRGRNEARKEIAKLSKRITKVGNQSVINLLSEILPDWSEASETDRKKVLTYVNGLIRQAKKWQPLKDGTAHQLLKQQFKFKVESELLGL